MTITLLVMNLTVDEIVLDYLVKVQYEDQTSSNDSPIFGETECDTNFIWAEDLWAQTSLVGIPEWMVLPGIDNVQITASNGDKSEAGPEDITSHMVNDEDDEELLASFVDVGSWCDELFYRLPLDVPRWAPLPGIDYPDRRRNSSYWKCNMKRYTKTRKSFDKSVFKRQLPTVLEEQVEYNNNGHSMLCVPFKFNRRYIFSSNTIVFITFCANNI
ncbi:hypothetical protein LOTGIDRAFT_160743 [Lottia gigantea]|uniref:Uncharacterized protein n=1 Tax=Lottia gigantea TaxID=225164 RepID=V4AN06_LOTGI|nr:hypothetical protein LOTGIDRAFT_160743 [Lottia gigantea]ESO94991.1 hypothetical protein LOTGIDRAFT_160743 [Lottia gigantea]